MPKYSIITVCLNEAEKIRKTCESIVAQTLADYEWIVIDGGSTDGTLDILDDYSASITQLVTEPDSGIYDAMNKGIAKCSGEYLIFMNGGDRFAADQVLDLASAAPQTDLIYGDIFYNEIGGEIETYPDVLNQGYLLKNMAPHQATFYRRSLFETYGNFDITYRIAADYDLNVRLLEVSGVSSHHVPKPLAVFDLSGISGNKQHRNQRKQENHLIRMRYFPQYRLSLKAWRQKIRHFLQKS